MSTIDELEKIFANVNYWLDYAERKNMSLFAFFSVFSVVAVVIDNSTSVSQKFTWGAVLFLVLYMVSLCIALCSLFAKTKAAMVKRRCSCKKKTAENLLYYGDIATYEPVAYREKLNECYGFTITDEDAHANDLVGQIVVNARIAWHKYRCFNWSARVLIVALVEFSICFICSVVPELFQCCL